MRSNKIIEWLFLLPIITAITELTLIEASKKSVIVTSPYGHIRGHQLQARNVQVNRFLGIPYATPPTGVLRFKNPVINPRFGPNPVSGDVINASHYCDACIQDKAAGLWMRLLSRHRMSENCLCLNIWTPGRSSDQPGQAISYDGESLLPVFFFIHGGAFMLGSGSSNTGTYLAAKGTVVVTMNYRLGPLGFLHSGNEEAPGNQGLKDQLLALKWVNENIKYFGGDANRITIAGQSAGSISVSDLLASPKSSGLFSSAMLMTGSILTAATFGSGNQLLDHSIELAIKLQCADESARLQIPDLNEPSSAAVSVGARGVNQTVEQGLLIHEGGQVEGHYLDDGQVQGRPSSAQSKRQGMDNRTMECLRKLRPSKYILNLRKGKKIGKRRKKKDKNQMNPFEGSFAFHPMGDNELLPSNSPFQLLNKSIEDPAKRRIRILVGTTDFEGGFFRMLPVTRKLAKRHKKSSNEEWKNFMRLLIKGEVSTMTNEDVETLVSKYFDLPPNATMERKQLMEWHLYNFYQFHGDLTLYCPTLFEVEVRNNASETIVHTYYFRHSTDKFWNLWKSPHGVSHGLEIPFFFGTPFSRKVRLLFNDQDRWVSDQAMNIVTKFVHGQELDWPRFDMINRPTLSIGTNIQVIKQVNSDKCQILNRYLIDFPFN